MSAPAKPVNTADEKPAGPVISTTEVTWRGGRAFDAGPAGRQHRIEAGGKDAPGPVETLLSAVATCSSIDIIDIIAKRKAPVERLSVSVTAERRPDFPRRVMKMRLDYHIDGAGIEREHAERAMQLSFERYCSVAASLAPDIAVEASLTLNGETFPPVTQKVWSITDAR